MEGERGSKRELERLLGYLEGEIAIGVLKFCLGEPRMRINKRNL